MAFVNRVTAVLGGFGTGIQNDSQLVATAVSLSTTSQQSKSLSSISPTISKGYVRVKIDTPGGTSPALVQVQVVADDGTTFVNIYDFNPTTALALATSSPSKTAPNVFDVLIPFELDINATEFTVNTTLSGTSPTAKLNVEVNGTV